jgi:hypothetical protein
MSWVASAILGAGVVNGAATAYAASQAAQAQTNAAQTAANTQLQMFNKTQSNLSPFVQGGQTAEQQLISQLPSLTAPVNMNEANLVKTPGYQFNLTQGTKAVQNAAAARGLGVSGAALKGATNYATGLADSTYQNQFANAVTNQTNAYNRLMGVVNTGANAAAGVGTAATTTGANIAATQIGAGNAQAAGINQTAAGIGTAVNNLPAAAYQGLYGNAAANSALPTSNAYANAAQQGWGGPGNAAVVT